MTREEKNEYNRNYRLLNKEKQRAYFKLYTKVNREKLSSNRAAKKDGLYTVYFLPKENYVGMTANIYERLRYHKSVKNRFVEDVEIFGKYETKEEAIRTESELHNIGYLGEHPRDRKRNQQLNK